MPTRRPPHAVLTLALLAYGLAACGLLGNKDDEGASAKPTRESAAGSAAPAGGPAAAAPGRSPVPQPAEFASQREVTVKGSSALGCETKMVREWLRISCRGKNSTGGTPTAVLVRKGGREVYSYASGGVTSLVFPFEEGADVEATFSWTNVGHKFVSRWPRGSAKPTVLGTFEGAASPLDQKNCIECFEEYDEIRAREQGKTCCEGPPCQNKAHCGGAKVCCMGIMGGHCRSACNLAFEGPTCTGNAECPEAWGTKLTCQPHPNGGKSCQGAQ